LTCLAGVAVGAGELSAEAAEELAVTKERLLRVEDELLASKGEVQRLRQRLLTAGIESDDADNATQAPNLSS